MTIQETYEEIITILESILEEYESDPIKKTKRYQNNLKKNTDYINKVIPANICFLFLAF